MQSFYRFAERHRMVEYDQMVDVYAYGVTLWELLAHAPPWEDAADDLDTIYGKVAAGERPLLSREEEASAPPGWTALMAACWHQNQSERPPFKAVLTFLRDIQRDLTHGTGGSPDASDLDTPRVPWYHLSLSDDSYTPSGGGGQRRKTWSEHVGDLMDLVLPGRRSTPSHSTPIGSDLEEPLLDDMAAFAHHDQHMREQLENTFTERQKMRKQQSPTMGGEGDALALEMRSCGSPGKCHDNFGF